MIEIFTDGGCSGNPGPGGWAFLAIHNETEHRASGAEPDTTNNRMELTAVIQALEWAAATGSQGIRISTDSQYVQLGISKWILSWEKNGWKTADKKPVKNKDLWQRLRELSRSARPEWVWVKGHAGNPRNEACDAMVQAEIKKLLKRE
ncbi:MAG: ribonuclease HI [Spirochaetales bacterium]|jgi:ribonuclease HI|nr:ribonuclease HI [Spirochaetales bacterium]